ncbi:MAG: branched-chain amino acid aminotransferase [Oligoflexales bacterium]|nr:branched-chain amino acid aminotransferase [Oligoflexales bacterium]
MNKLTSQLSLLEIEESLEAKISNYQVSKPLGFGTQIAPVMAKAVYEDGKWGPLEMTACEAFDIHPAMKAFHYGQQIFEGMKAYRAKGKGPFLFRADQHAKRFNMSAERMAMPSIPEDTFLEAVTNVVYRLKEHVPQEDGESLYLRPLMLATETGLHLSPSTSYLFLAMASPSATYFSPGKVSALIERTDARAAPGGTGAVKAAGNYGGSIRSSIKAKDLGYQQTLWLDAVNKKNIEEFSGMNFFACINNKLLTPELNSSILPGITRSSVLKIAESFDVECKEQDINIDELVEAIKSEQCTEIFACGTAAVISPISSLGEKDGTKYELSYKHEDLLWKRIREELVGIQLGDRDDPYSWRSLVSF